MVNKTSSSKGEGALLVIVLLVFLFALVLPLSMLIYIDTLSMKTIVSKEVKKSMQLRNQLEQCKKSCEEVKGEDK